MKLLQLLIILLFTQTTGLAYTVNYHPPIYNRMFYRRGVMTGIPAPIIQYNVPTLQQPDYVNVKRKHIKKKYRKYYPKNMNSSFTIIEN